MSHKHVDSPDTISAFEAFNVGRFGLRVDPTGAQVMFRGCLWDVTGHYYRDTPAAFMLTLRSFNGQNVAEAPLSAVRVLIRR